MGVAALNPRLLQRPAGDIDRPRGRAKPDQQDVESLWSLRPLDRRPSSLSWLTLRNRLSIIAVRFLGSSETLPNSLCSTPVARNWPCGLSWQRAGRDARLRHLVAAEPFALAGLEHFLVHDQPPVDRHLGEIQLGHGLLVEASERSIMTKTGHWYRSARLNASTVS